jgi:hypothetical protein
VIDARPKESGPGIDVVVARIDETEDQACVLDLDVALVERIETYELAGETGADELPAKVECDRTVCTNAMDVCHRVLEFGEGFGIATSRRLVQLRRCLELESLVRTHAVVLVPELVERPLLPSEAVPRRRTRRLLEGQVHALMPTVLLRLARIDALEGDAQASPPG